MTVNRLMVLNANSTNLDDQPAATIVEGRNFKTRLKELFKQHYDAEVAELKVTPHPEVPKSFTCMVKIEGHDEEEFVLLKSWDY